MQPFMFLPPVCRNSIRYIDTPQRFMLGLKRLNSISTARVLESIQLEFCRKLMTSSAVVISVPVMANNNIKVQRYNQAHRG